MYDEERIVEIAIDLLELFQPILDRAESKGSVVLALEAITRWTLRESGRDLQDHKLNALVRRVINELDSIADQEHQAPLS